MKRAYQYIRISQEDQSNFSITGQKRFNEGFAGRIDCEIVRTFIDDGRSAKDFNRPQWRLLEKELYRNRSRIDYLIISKYDRLIRNVREGLVFLEKIENKWGIRVISAMEDYYSHPDDPMFLRDRTQRLLDAEVERLRISDRVKFGHWQAANEGRYIFNAPYGYINERDEYDKPIITIHQERSQVVKFIFESFLRGIPMTTIMERSKEKGFYLKGNSSITRILSNPIYAGLVNVKSYRNEKERLMKGIHEPVVSEQSYYTVQNILKSQEYGSQMVMRDDLPLRGIISCMDCGSIYTGGRSKGRNKYYLYYRCPQCAGVNLSAPKVHHLINDILSKINIPEKYLSYITLKSKKRIEEIQKDESKKQSSLKLQIESIDRKLDSVNEKFIMDQLTPEVYKKYKSRYEAEKYDLKKIIERKSNPTDPGQFINDILLLIKDLPTFFDQLSTSGKQIFFSGVFGSGSKVSLELFEPVFMHPVFDYNTHKISKLILKETPDIGHYSGVDKGGVLPGSQFEPIIDLVDIMKQCLSA